ncbi:hypothetical protein FK004_02945 [Flavobacterium kingsejongi]|uniref:Uncharacterized protein n=1 Tax=Flavobacterium kingsejongi TaxID=1678728 RepID=A0A2S1LKG5_9FLAO|nr:hypothetical protein FK004_02945 [Flavobacterium kingsejongi]
MFLVFSSVKNKEEVTTPLYFLHQYPISRYECQNTIEKTVRIPNEAIGIIFFGYPLQCRKFAAVNN